MNSAVENCYKLETNFENREAIYIEEAVLHVRVKNIRTDPCKEVVAAVVEEIPTPGLGIKTFRDLGVTRPVSWSISTGSIFETRFSDSSWAAGYGGWDLFFSPRIIRDVLELASGWSKDLELSARYSEVYELLINSRAYQPTEFLFPGKPDVGG